MNSNINITPNPLPNQLFAVRQERRKLIKIFWLGVIVLFLVEIFTAKASSTATVIGAILIAFNALLPVYLWCSGKALGMPIFPLFSLTFLWTHALPLVSDHPTVVTYSPEEHLFASATVSGFLGLATFIWFQFVNKIPGIPKSYRLLRGQDSDVFFLFMLALGILFNMYFLGGWFPLSSGAFALVRGSILGLNVLAVFVLSYRFGTRELSGNKSKLFLALLALHIISSAASLLLVGALSIFLIAAIAFIIGRRQVPWLAIILVLLCMGFLHSGKGEMRAEYWGEDEEHHVQPWEYPAWYGEWINYSFEYFINPDSSQEDEEKSSLLERSSVMQMLLIAQKKSPVDRPYLSGLTYTIIPNLLIPRLINSDKLPSHAATYFLSIYYGLQSYEGTLTTTIGWGLLSEAYANFGLSGCAGLALIVGAGYGQATRWSLNTPMLSFRSLFGVLLLSFAFQSEWTAGVYAASLFQSTVALGVITIVFMKTHTNRDNLFIPYG